MLIQNEFIISTELKACGETRRERKYCCCHVVPLLWLCAYVTIVKWGCFSECGSYLHELTRCDKGLRLPIVMYRMTFKVRSSRAVPPQLQVVAVLTTMRELFFFAVGDDVILGHIRYHISDTYFYA